MINFQVTADSLKALSNEWSKMLHKQRSFSDYNANFSLHGVDRHGTVVTQTEANQEIKTMRKYVFNMKN